MGSPRRSKPERIELEWLLTDPAGFGLSTATPLQRAICRASDGLAFGDLWDDPEVRQAFGGVCPPGVAPAVFCILAAIRCAKSMISAAKAIQITQNMDLNVPWISAGDEIRIPVVSVDKDRARVVFSHILGNIQSRPALRQLLIGEPTAESLWIKHPSGRAIEVCVTALAKSGSSLVARWLPCVIFDEAPLMAGVQDGKKNLDEALAAIEGRVLPGGQVMLIGSPWAPFGPIYELVQEHFGKPTENCVIVRAPGPAMNPVYWTPERCEETRRRNPGAYRTNVLAEFADPEEALFSSIEVEDATRSAPLERPPEVRHHYVASMDPAMRGNAWTLLIVGCTGELPERYTVAVARQWIGSKTTPLKADLVLAEIAGLCIAYGIDSVTTDQHNVDTLGEIASRHGIGLVQHAIRSENRLEMVERARVLLSEGLLELPPDPVFRSDLLAARRRVTQNGVTLVLPRTGDGRHADYVPALGLALVMPPAPPDPEQPVVDRHFQETIRTVDRRTTEDFWEAAARRVAGF